MNQPSQQALRDLLAEAHVQSAQADRAEALGWVIICRDEENGHLHLSGLYAEPEYALAAAAADHARVNARLPEGEPGWTHTVWPLFPPSSLDRNVP